MCFDNERLLVILRKILFVLIVSLPSLSMGMKAGPDSGIDTHSDLPQIVLQSGHTLPITHLSFSPTDRYVGTSSYDGTVKIWDARNGRLLRTIANSPFHTYCSVFSASEKFIASISADMKLNIWGVEDGHLEKSLDVTVQGNKPKGLQMSDLDPRELADLIVAENVFENIETMGGTFSIPSQKMVFRPDYNNFDIPEEDKGYKPPAAISSDGRYKAGASEKNELILYRVKDGRRVVDPVMSLPSIRDIAFSRDGRYLAVAMSDGDARLLDLRKGLIHNLKNPKPKELYSVFFDREANVWAAALDGFRLWELPSGESSVPLLMPSTVGGVVRDFDRLYWRSNSGLYRPALLPVRGLSVSSNTGVRPKFRDIWAAAISSAEPLIAYGGYEQFLSIYNYSDHSQKEILVSEEKYNNPTSLKVSSDNSFLAIGYESGQVELVEMSSMKRIALPKMHESPVESISFTTTDAGIMASTEMKNGRIVLWEIDVAKKSVEFKKDFEHGSPVFASGFIDGGKLLISSGADSQLKVWERSTGNLVKTLTEHTASVNAVAVSDELGLIASGGADGTIRLWDKDGLSLLATIVSFDNYNWAVMDVNGFFDGTQWAWQQMPLRLPSTNLSLYEPERFFNLFYQPGMLSDIAREAKPIRRQLSDQKDSRANLDISTYRSSKLPVIKIIEPIDGRICENRHMQLNLELKDAGSGIRDLRIFRNQTLVAIHHGNLLKGEKAKTKHESISIKIIAGQNEISAYAFNNDGLRSKEVKVVVNGAPSLKRSKAAYIIGIGINHYQNTNFNLKYATHDAVSMVEALEKSLERKGVYDRIQCIELLDQNASKANITAALDILSGKSTAVPAGSPSGFDKLAKTEPEDTIIMFYSGHGMALGDRLYYLIPHDLGYLGARENMSEENCKTIAKNSISNVDLEGAFENIDGENFLLIIDACQSGQALESEEKRRGPMNSRGLEQLAYEKGMYILAAAQSRQVAIELERFGHGALTYAMIENGLNRMAADVLPKDERLSVREWIDYAVTNVPSETEAAFRALAEKASTRGVAIQDLEIAGQAPKAYYRRFSNGQDWILVDK